MSSFACDQCGSIHQDTPCGYVTGCQHYSSGYCEACGERMVAWNDGLACPHCFLEQEAGDEPGK